VFNCSFFFPGDFVHLFVQHEEFGDYFFTVGASLLYRMCTGCMVR
jgi:hypothetical protein